MNVNQVYIAHVYVVNNLKSIFKNILFRLEYKILNRNLTEVGYIKRIWIGYCKEMV